MNKKRIYLTIVFLIVSKYLLQGQVGSFEPLRLKVGTYNIGHFNQGRLGGFQGSGNIVEAELNNWKYWIGQQSLDIIGLNEWNEYFDKDSLYNASESILKPFYNHIYFGKENTWIYNGIATNHKLDNIQQIDWHGEYYALVGELEIGGKLIHVISTHIPWQKEWHTESLQSLISLLETYNYFICMGDMNAPDKNQLKFLEKGFNMANGGNMGWFSTASGSSSRTGYKGSANVNIDNIITSSNIKIMNVQVPKTGLNDLDHLPIIADIIITD